MMVALLAMTLAGTGLSFGVTGRSVRVGAALRVGLGFALGLGGVSLVMFVASLSGAGWDRPFLLLVPVAAVGIAGMLRRGDVRSQEVVPRGPWLIDVALMLVILSAVLVVAQLALDKPVWSYDALSRWMFKAKAFFHDRSVVPYFEDTERGVTQPHYPPLVSLGASFIYLVMGREEDRMVKGLFVAVFVVLLCAVYGLLRRRTSSTIALVATSLIAIAPVMVHLDWPPGVGAHAAMADIPLALFTLLAFGLVMEWARTGQRSLLWNGMICAGFAPWIKQEGALVLALAPMVACAAAALGRRDRTQWVAILASTAAAVAIFLPWYLFQRGVPVTDEVYLPGGFGVQTLIDHADRLPVIARAFFVEMVRTEHWNLLFPLGLAALLLAPRAAIRNGAWVLFIVVVAHLVAYAVVYAIEDFKGRGAYEQKMAISLARLLMHVAPLVALIFGLQVEALRRSRRGVRRS